MLCCHLPKDVGVKGTGKLRALLEIKGNGVMVLEIEFEAEKLWNSALTPPKF
jgi:hypothetical protein